MAATLPELSNYIDNETSVPALERGSNVCNANTGEPIQPQLSCSPTQVERALAATHAAWLSGEWEHTPAVARADILDGIADVLARQDNIDTIAFSDAVTTGAVIRTTRRMAELAPLVFRGAAQYIRSGALERSVPGPCGDVDYIRRPWGPALLVSPWNGPTAIGSHKIASALAAGAPCIAKPSEWAPHSAIVMAAAIHEVGLPRGTFQLTCGNRVAGAQMVDDSRVKAISFTGGLAGGRVIARACADDFRPAQLELGGNNQLVVFADADLERAAEGIVYGMTNLNGQWCRALGRILVHRSIKDALLERVDERLAAVRLGDSLDEASDMGPLVNRGQYDQINREIDQLEALGGRRLCSTPMPNLPGYFVPPTLLDGCDPAQTCDEIFGPVAAVHSFDTDAEALALANGTQLGLAGYVYSGDEQRAFAFAREMRTGGVKINGYSLFSLGQGAPRSAWGLSGIGEEGVSQSVDFFVGARVIGISPQDVI